MDVDERPPNRGPHDRGADGAAIVAIVVGAAIAWWPTRNLPYFWDGAGFVVDAARDMLHSGFTPLIPTHAYFAHPPLFMALVALAWGAFGESREVAHAVVLPFLPIAMLALYALGRRLNGRLLGFAAALAFGVLPPVLCEYGQIYFDLPMAAVTACAILAWTARKPWVAGALFAVAALMKIPAAAVPASLAVMVALSARTRRDWRSYAALAMPFVAIGVWLVYHHAVTGWWLSTGPRSRLVLGGPRAIVDHAAIVGRVCFVAQRRWTLVVAAAAGAVVLHRRGERVWEPRVGMLAGCFAGGFVFIACTNEFLVRYILFIMPPLVLGVLLVLRRAIVRPALFAVAVAAILGAQATAWHPALPRTSEFEVEPNDDLSYRDMIDVGVRAAGYVQRRHARAEIYGGFHERYELGEPWQGYVDQPLDVRPCGVFERHPAAEQLVYIHAYAPEQRVCRQVVEQTGASALRRFESNGKWIEVWRVPALQEAAGE